MAANPVVKKRNNPISKEDLQVLISALALAVLIFLAGQVWLTNQYLKIIVRRR